MRKPEYLYFTLEEYQRRLDALRSRMEEKGVDAMLVYTPENLCYLTGFQTPAYLVYNALIVPVDREPVFVTRGVEADIVEHMSVVEDSRPWADSEDWIAKTKDALVDLRLENKRIGVEYDSQCALIQDYLRLTAALPRATFVDCSGLVEQGRMIKSPQEVAYMREAARAALAAIEAGVAACAVGATENDVAGEMHRAQIIAGSEYTGCCMFIKSGRRTGMGHVTWDRKRIEPNDIVDMEVPGCVRRYHAAKWTQVHLGEPAEDMLKAYEVATEANKAARSFIKAGVTGGEVFEVIRETAESYDMGTEPDQRVGYSHRPGLPAGLGGGSHHQHQEGGGAAARGRHDLPSHGHACHKVAGKPKTPVRFDAATPFW